jgi:hypothetical protein
VSAVPDPGYHFVDWSDGLTDNPRTDTNVVADVNVTANFAINTYTLTVSKPGTGSGRVTSPAGIDCGSNCSESYNYNTVVTLTATAFTGSTFTGWSGACSGTGTCQVIMSAARSVTANFAINTYTLTYSAGPSGSISGTTPQVVNHGESGTPVSAVPDPGYHFVDWSDGLTDNPRTDTNVVADGNVTANFAINTYTLTVSTSGSGTVTSSPSGIDCGSVCSESYNYNTVVTLTATASADSSFTGWSGEGCSGTDTCQVTMTAAMSVTATFTSTSNPQGDEPTPDAGSGSISQQDTPTPMP